MGRVKSDAAHGGRARKPRSTGTYFATHALRARVPLRAEPNAAPRRFHAPVHYQGSHLYFRKFGFRFSMYAFFPSCPCSVM